MSTFQHGNGTTLETLWPHHTHSSWWRPSPCSCCCDSQVSIRLKTTSRKTQPHVARSHWIGSETTEHRSFRCMAEGSLSRTLAYNCGSGYVEEAYAMKREAEYVGIHSVSCCSVLLLLLRMTSPFLPARIYASVCSICYSSASVRLFVRHNPAFCRNACMDRACFLYTGVSPLTALSLLGKFGHCQKKQKALFPGTLINGHPLLAHSFSVTLFAVCRSLQVLSTWSEWQTVSSRPMSVHHSLQHGVTQLRLYY